MKPGQMYRDDLGRLCKWPENVYGDPAQKKERPPLTAEQEAAVAYFDWLSDMDGAVCQRNWQLLRPLIKGEG